MEQDDRRREDGWYGWPPAGSQPTEPSPASAGTNPYDRTAWSSAPAPVPTTTEPSDPVAAPPPRRRWPWVVALVLLAGIAGGAMAVAVDQRETAAHWRDRAQVLEAQRDEALGQSESLGLQLDEVAQLLDISEADVAALEARIRELADEKAQAEDTATTVQVERDVFVDLTTRIAEATEALDACVTRLFDLQSASVEAFNRTSAGEPVDVEPLNAQARETTTFCNEARSAAAAAGAAADQLRRP